MKTTTYISLYILANLGSLCFSQPTLQWARTYNGLENQNDLARAVVTDNFGNIYVCGITNFLNLTRTVTIKYDSQGDSLWVRRFVPLDSSASSGLDIIIDDLEYVYVTGRYTIKYNPNGQQIWAKLFGGKKIALDTNGYFVVSTESSTLGFVTLKFDSNGDTIWRRTYTVGTASVEDLAVDRFNNIIVAGSHYTGVGQSYNFLTLKYNSSGNLVWVRTFNGPDPNAPYDFIYGAAVDDTGNVYVTGWSDDTDGGADYYTIKYDSSGNTKWERRFGIGGSAAYDIALDKQGNVFVTGVTSTFNYTTVKYSNNGNLLWYRTVSGVSFPPRNVLTIDTMGNVYVGAQRERTGGWTDVSIVKYNSNGNQEWLVYYPGSGLSAGLVTDIITDVSGNIFAVGSDRVINWGAATADYLTLKYSQPIGIKITATETPENYVLFQNYPNPFNPETKIKFDIPSNVKSETANVKLIVFDVLGREVAVLVNGQLKPGNYEVEWDASNYPSGVYFYRIAIHSDKLVMDGFVDTKRMVLIK